MAYSFDKDKFEQWKNAQKESIELQKQMNSGISGYLKTIESIGEIQKNLKHVEKNISKLKKEQAEFEKQKKLNEIEIGKLKKSGLKLSSKEISDLLKQNKELKKKIIANSKGVEILEDELNILKEQTNEISKQVKGVNKLAVGFKSTVRFLAQTPGLIRKGYGKLRQTGIFEMDKEIRNATKSMAGGQRTYERLFDTITKTSDTTTLWGVGVRDLAMLQQGYSEAIGRSVMLTESGLKAMAGLSEGTGLGRDYAVQMAGAMDLFNISAERTSEIVESNMNNAAQLGVNGAAALKSLQQNLKLAQRFTFKGGVKGLSDMSVKATRLRLDMEGIAGMAEKVFRPEGAIEMAANLATMGGEFAKLGDPMQLMFKARNDFEGFANDIGKATKEFLSFNEKTGEFNIKSGLAADRMREISNMTGISVEKLQEMGEAQARLDRIGRSTLISFGKEDLMAIETASKFVEGKGFVVNVDGVEKSIKNISKLDVERLKGEQKTLEERAKLGRTFDETINDIILLFKQQLLPFAETLKKGVGDPMIKLMDQWKKEGFFDSLKKFIKSGAEVAASIGKFAIGAAEWFGPKGLLAIGAIFSVGKWALYGRTLGMGFNSVARVTGGSNMLGKNKGLKGGIPRLAKAAKHGGVGGFAKSALRIGKSTLKTNALTSLVMGGFDAYSNIKEGKSAGESIGRAAITAIASGLGGFGGSLLLPGAGTIAGGVAGGMAGQKLGDLIFGSEERNDPMSELHSMGDGIVFNPQDKFMKINDHTMIAGTQVSGNAKLAEAISGKKSETTNGEVRHKFDDINVKIEISVPGTSDLGVELAKDQSFIRRINEAITEQITMVVGGGKLNPNPKGV